MNIHNKRYKTIVLLTACVNPNGMSHTKLQDIEIRKQQYIDALNFYLQKTLLPICFVENTGYDMSKEFQDYINTGRLEYLCFYGNNYARERGKGYGEAKIILYSLYHSQMMRNCKYFIKVTGRVIVPDIEKIAKSPFLSINSVFRSDILGKDFIRTVVFITTPKIIGDILESRIEDITEKKGYILEEIIASELIYRKYIHVIPFFSTVYINGIFATKNIPYENISSIVTLRDNLYFLSIIEEIRGFKLRRFFTKLLYYLTFIYCLHGTKY